MVDPHTANSSSPSAFTCKQCEKQFSTAESLEMHVSAKHFQHVAKPLGENIFKKYKGKIIVLAIVFLLGAGLWALYSAVSNSPRVGPVGSTHIHSDIKVYVDGLPINFASQKYQLRSQHVHFESGEGDYVHIHATGVTLGLMFESLGMKLSSQCLKLDDGRNLCNGDGGGKTLKFYVNNATNAEFGNYVFRDLDKILVSYGAETEQEVQFQLASVTDKARNENAALVSDPLAAHRAQGG